jgi:hypothetical protein
MLVFVRRCSGGTLTVTNLGGTLAAGDSFKLFNTGSCSGSFASLSPAAPGTGLVWNTNTLAGDGTLRIAAAASPAINNVARSGDSFLLSATGGPPGPPYRVLTSTNMVLSLTNWTLVWTDTFDSFGSGQFTSPFSLSTPQQFFNIVLSKNVGGGEDKMIEIPDTNHKIYEYAYGKIFIHSQFPFLADARRRPARSHRRVGPDWFNRLRRRTRPATGTHLAGRGLAVCQG